MAELWRDEFNTLTSNPWFLIAGSGTLSASGGYLSMTSATGRWLSRGTWAQSGFGAARNDYGLVAKVDTSIGIGALYLFARPSSATSSVTAYVVNSHREVDTLFRYTGSWTALGSSTNTSQTEWVSGIHCSGPSIRAYRNGAQVVSVTNSQTTTATCPCTMILEPSGVSGMRLDYVAYVENTSDMTIASTKPYFYRTFVLGRP